MGKYGDLPEWLSVVFGFLALGGVVFAYFQWKTPHDFTPELQQQYAAQVRQAYQGDLKLDQAETQALDKFITDHKLQKKSVDAFSIDLTRRMKDATQDIGRGLALARQRRFDDARREFMSAAAVDPDNSAAWADLGAANMELGRVDEGRKNYDRALVLAPDDWRTRFNFGLFFARMNNPEAALSQFQQVFRPAGSGAGPAGQQLQQVLRAAETDPVLAGLRKDPRFQDLLRTAKNGS